MVAWKDRAYLYQFVDCDSMREKLDAVQNHKSSEKAAKSLGISLRVLTRALQKLEAKAALAGVSPEHDMTKPAPAGYYVKGTSTLYDDAGNVKQQWVKTDVDHEQRLLLLKQSIIDSISDYNGSMGCVKAPKITSNDMMHLIPIGDPHIGMYAWAEEAGEDFDTEIARRDLLRGVQLLMDSAPSCGECVIFNAGDMFHADSMDNKTWRSGHALDVDTRYGRVIRIGLRLMIDIVNEARKKHKKVRIISVPGNHDDHSGLWIGVALAEVFSNDKRVTVDISPSPYRYHRFGKNLFGFTHGHLAKMADLGAIMAHDKPLDWGDTVYRYWHSGHVHSRTVHDGRGWVAESHRTLASQDAWSSGAGYRSGRDIKGICYHREYGEVNRATLDIRAIRAMT